MFAALIEVFIVSIVPITLIKFGVISSKIRLFVLLWIFIILTALIHFQGVSLMELGIRLDNLSSSIYLYFVAVVVSVITLIILSKILGNKRAEKWYEDPHFLFLFIPISIAQQFLYQGFILLKLDSVFPAAIAVATTALIFGYMHTIYPRPLFSMVLGTAGGVLFATLYVIHPNLLLASVSHALLNFTAIYLGFFTFVDSEGVPKKTDFFN